MLTSWDSDTPVMVCFGSYVYLISKTQISINSKKDVEFELVCTHGIQTVFYHLPVEKIQLQIIAKLSSVYTSNSGQHLTPDS